MGYDRLCHIVMHFRAVVQVWDLFGKVVKRRKSGGDNTKGERYHSDKTHFPASEDDTV